VRTHPTLHALPLVAALALLAALLIPRAGSSAGLAAVPPARSLAPHPALMVAARYVLVGPHDLRLTVGAKATITVTVTTAGGDAVNSASITILPKKH
jgi:hypothetical protein